MLNMKHWSRRLLPFLLALQLSFLLAHARSNDDVASALSTEQSTTTSIALESGTPRQDTIPEQDGPVDKAEGYEKVSKALTILRRYERLSPSSSSKSTGLLGQLAQYALAAFPSFSAQGPSHASSQNNRIKGLPTQMREAVGLLDQAAKVNNTDAIYLLAQMNFYGNFTYPKDFGEAFRRYEQLATLNGNSSAQHMLGFMYGTGIGNAVSRSPAKSLLYHTFAAKGGNTRSEMTLAFKYHAGIGTARNCEIAVQHYKNVARKAMEWYRSGPPGGMAWVPDSYRLADEDGGVYGEGASYSSAGENAKSGNPSADANAALDDVLEYLDLMSRKGDFKATFSMGRIHYDGQKGLPRDLDKAKQYFMKVAKLYWQKNGQVIDTDKPKLEEIATKAAGYLGKMFLRGEGVEQSNERAQVWFKRGIKSGDAGSQYGMGLVYLHGLGVERDPVRATEFLKASAEQNYPSAQVALGALYLDQGSANDITIANRYFDLAARWGHIESYYYLAELIEQGLGRDRSCGLASAYYKTVAEKVEPLLSSFAEANRAFNQGDNELALIGYMHAAEQGWEKGQSNVAYLLDQEKSNWSLSWLMTARPRSPLLQNAALALIYWTRSSKQTNIDSLVKMGDYYLSGIGTPVDMEKAASCYQAATEFQQSAQACFNLGWMHENGVGLDQDFHLAKRYYDQALEINDEAYLPVTLSLFKLRLRSAWNTLTHGRIKSIQDEPVTKKEWSLSEWISNFLQDDNSYWADDHFEDDYLPDNDPMPGGDSDGMYDDIIDDGIIESLVLIGLGAALVFLIYYRQARQLAHRQNELAAAQHDAQQAVGEQQQQPEQGGVGLFPQPGDPAFGQWVAGGVGH